MPAFQCIAFACARAEHHLTNYKYWNLVNDSHHYYYVKFYEKEILSTFNSTPGQSTLDNQTFVDGSIGSLRIGGWNFMQTICMDDSELRQNHNQV